MLKRWQTSPQGEVAYGEIIATDASKTASPSSLPLQELLGNSIVRGRVSVGSINRYKRLSVVLERTQHSAAL